MTRITPPLERLLKRIIKEESGCWTYNGHVSKRTGYCQFKMNRNPMGAHRASWILHFGEIPNGLFVLHKCIGNRRCVNPDHLKLGTAKDNSADMISQGRAHDQNGSKNHAAKMTENNVKGMRSVPYYRGIYVHFAKKFSVEISVVRRAYLGLTWKHIK